MHKNIKLWRLFFYILYSDMLFLILYTLRINKKFTIFNYKAVFSIEITSCVNFGTPFRKKNIDDVRAIF